jgi:soluble lytic murein transglycosylase-like protein/Kef-type K+ transport system membrane component KefB
MQVATLALDIGISGLLFVGGIRFDPNRIWKARRLSVLIAGAGLILMALIAIVLKFMGAQDLNVAIAVAAAITATSLWLPGELSVDSEKNRLAPSASQGGAAILGAIAAAALYSLAVTHQYAGRPLSKLQILIIAVYEMVKLAVFFGLAYFFASRFLHRAEGRIPPARVTAGFLLIAILLFALAVSTIGPIGAFAWSFVAGAVFAGSSGGRSLGRVRSPVASAVFLLLSFVPLVLQSHGRTLNDLPALSLVVAGALTAKFVFAFTAARIGGASRGDARLIAASALGSGEVALMILGTAMTTWPVESLPYFAVLSFALLSMTLGAAIWTLSNRRMYAAEAQSNESAQEIPSDAGGRKSNSRPKTRGRSGKRLRLAVLAAGALLSIQQSSRAQSSPARAEDDPVERAMKRIDAAAGRHAQSADTVLAASELVNESAVARREGKRDLARESLSGAEKAVAEASEFNRTALIDELARLIAEERYALSGARSARPAELSLPKRARLSLHASVLARLGQYRESLVRILEEEEVPVELLGVALVESGFNPLSLSPKGARGIWQFMPATALRYGLAVQPGNDQRTHPELSTRAAARYLRDLYRQFGDWKLALAAYNWGENNVQAVIDRTGIRSFEELAHRGLLPRETRNYVPAALAAWSRFGADGRGQKRAPVPGPINGQ